MHINDVIYQAAITLAEDEGLDYDDCERFAREVTRTADRDGCDLDAAWQRYDDQRAWD